jgi:RHS repeat-associated protein
MKLELVRQFIGGPGTDDIEATRYHGRYLWHAKDSLGSTIALTNRGGHAVAKIGYDAFGNLKFPDKPGHGVKPCDDKDLPDWLDRLEFGRSFGFDFDPHHFGRHFGRVITPVLFTGRRWDSFSQTYNNRNRYYSPKVGRFTSRDPIGFDGGLNLWAYPRNPLRFTDPWGLAMIWLEKKNTEYTYNSTGEIIGEGEGRRDYWKDVSEVYDTERPYITQYSRRLDRVRIIIPGYFISWRNLFEVALEYWSGKKDNCEETLARFTWKNIVRPRNVHPTPRFPPVGFFSKSLYPDSAFPQVTSSPIDGIRESVEPKRELQY